MPGGNWTVSSLACKCTCAFSIQGSMSVSVSFPSCCPFCSPVLVLERILSPGEELKLPNYFPKLRQELSLLKKSRVFFFFFFNFDF